MFHGSLFVRSVKILEIPSRSVPRMTARYQTEKAPDQSKAKLTLFSPVCMTPLPALIPEKSPQAKTKIPSLRHQISREKSFFKSWEIAAKRGAGVCSVSPGCVACFS